MSALLCATSAVISDSAFWRERGFFSRRAGSALPAAAADEALSVVTGEVGEVDLGVSLEAAGEDRLSGDGEVWAVGEDKVGGEWTGADGVEMFGVRMRLD